jgi:hypothetical protein
MLCFIHKWNISRAFDSGKPLARLTKGHLVRCETCREFSRLGEEMGRRLTEDEGQDPGSAKEYGKLWTDLDGPHPCRPRSACS